MVAVGPLPRPALLLCALASPLAFCLGMDTIWSFEGGWGGLAGMALADAAVRAAPGAVKRP